MKILMSGVAKVSSAVIDINGMTVIAGFNGTGKSTICKALYSMCTAFGGLNKNIADSKRQSIYNCASSWDIRHYEGGELLDFRNGLSEKLNRMLRRREISTEDITEDMLRELAAGTAKEKDIKALYGDLRKVIERPYEEYARFAVERVFTTCFSDQINTLDSADEAKIRLQLDDKTAAEVKFAGNKLMKGTFSQISVGTAVYIETNSYLDRVAPVLRGAQSSRKIPGNALNDRKDEEITLEQYDALEKARTICGQIISEVTHGELVSTPDREIFYKENNYSTNIRVGNIASGLKNILLIQKMLDNGSLNAQSLLIIDEPEVNLHPEWQVKFADILVQLHNKLGMKMLLNTHSPYFMRAVESKLAEYGIADQGKYYYMTESDRPGFVAEDVTGRTDIVYQTMYKPLEEL